MTQIYIGLRHRGTFRRPPDRGDRGRRDRERDSEGAPEHGIVAARDNKTITVMRGDSLGIVDHEIAKGDTDALIGELPCRFRKAQARLANGGADEGARPIRIA